MNIEPLRGFVCLEERKHKLDSERIAKTMQIDHLEQVLLPQFLSDGVARSPTARLGKRPAVHEEERRAASQWSPADSLEISLVHSLRSRKE